MSIIEYNTCSNCGACYNICPNHAISLDSNGLFYKYKVDSEKCVECGLCQKVCPVNNTIDENIPLASYAGWHNEQDVVLNSSSGGAFYALANEIIKKGGIVYGAHFSANFKNVVFGSSDKVNLKLLQKSKYVESDVMDSFKKIKKELVEGKLILFCGTPCQVAGLKHFLGKNYGNLITCDFTCGGVPSHKMYLDYLDNLENHFKSPIKSVDFRPKTHGWQRYAILIKFYNGKKYNRLKNEDPYLRLFLEGKYSVRDYCLECKFSKSHLSDITLADFWLYKKYSKLTNKRGISLIVCNTTKGIKFVEKLQNFCLESISLDKGLYNYVDTKADEHIRKSREKFLDIYIEKGFMKAYESVFNDSLNVKIKNRIKNKILFILYKLGKTNE